MPKENNNNNNNSKNKIPEKRYESTRELCEIFHIF